MEAEKGILYADIDLDDIIKAKRMFDVVGHYSRPDVFLFDLKNKN
jgi:nitrilase